MPQIRVAACNANAVRESGDFVLYWMTSFRRVRDNFALDRAIEWSAHLGKPLVILEALRADYPWASDRFHKFIIDGMRDNQKALRGKPVTYYSFIETEIGRGKGLLFEFSRRSCVVVTDDYPCFFIPRMTAVASEKIPVLLEKVDSNGLMPIRVNDKDFVSAHQFRRFMQKTLPEILQEFPRESPLEGIELPILKKLPDSIASRWAPFNFDKSDDFSDLLRSLPVDHGVLPVDSEGGEVAAEKAMRTFLDERLAHYTDERNEPSANAASGLSAYFHFGHLSAHRVFRELMKHEKWAPDRLAMKASGSRSDWWGVGKNAEAFLDQLITWREIGFHRCAIRDDYDHFESLPGWAKKTLMDHAADEREYRYDLKSFERAETHDPLWNAAQRQLVSDGVIHNYLRMLWGKKILEWSAHPAEALSIMIHLNNKYALDGRDPNSYSGILWCLGLFDRPWGPERNVFGKIRYMSSENTKRKIETKPFCEKYSKDSRKT